MEDHLHAHFKQAYNTGTDYWSRIAYELDIRDFLHELNSESFILDIGSGRGKVDILLARSGHYMVGIDLIPNVVIKANAESERLGLKKNLHFDTADARNMPFKNESFDASLDIQALTYLNEHDRKKIINEIRRVLKPRGYFLSVALSSETPELMGMEPDIKNGQEFERYGICYRFMTPENILEWFGDNFTIKRSRVFHYPMPDDETKRIALLFTLMQKK